jgi:hypothetical protein
VYFYTISHPDVWFPKAVLTCVKLPFHLRRFPTRYEFYQAIHKFSHNSYLWNLQLNLCWWKISAVDIPITCTKIFECLSSRYSSTIMKNLSLYHWFSMTKHDS